MALSLETPAEFILGKASGQIRLDEIF